MRFSLLIPAFNRPDLIVEAVASAIANAGSDVEVVVSEDASPRQDEVAEALAPWTRSGAIRFFRQPKNLGWSANRNFLVSEARGEWVILFGDDDRLKPGALNRLRHWQAVQPGADLYGFGYDVIDADGVYHFGRRSPRGMRYEVPRTQGWEELYHFDALPMWSHHPFTMCYPRELGLALRYQAEAGIADDVLFLFDALQGGRCLFVIPESLFEWRRVEVKTKGYVGLSSDWKRSQVAHRALGGICCADRTFGRKCGTC